MQPALRILSEPPTSGFRALSEQSISTPYVGGRAFSESEAHLFFGRDRDIAECIDRLEARHLLVVVGERGSGRTSLVRAGLPRVARSRLALPTSPELALLYLDLSQGDPLAELARQLLRWQTERVPHQTADGLEAPLLGESEIRDLLSSSDAGLTRVASLVGAASRPLLIVADGLEHVQAEGAGKIERLWPLLSRAARCPEAHIFVGITATPESFLWAERVVPGADLLNRSVWVLRAPTPGSLKEIIEGPARLRGVTPDSRCTQQVSADVARLNASLGRLSHALQRTWQTWRDQDDAQRTEAPSVTDYESAGGVEYAFELHADALFDRAPQRERDLIELVIRRLGADESPRQQTALPSLTSLEPFNDDDIDPPSDRFDARLALQPWVELGLLSIHDELAPDDNLGSSAGQKNTAYVRLAFQGALEAWPRFRLWVHSERALLAQYRRWVRLAECGTAGEPETILRGELLRQATLFWQRYSAKTDSRGDFDAKDGLPESNRIGLDPGAYSARLRVARMIETSESLQRDEVATRSRLERALAESSKSQAARRKASRRADVSVMGLVLTAFVALGLGVNRWQLGVQNGELIRAQQDVREEKQRVDEVNTQVLAQRAAVSEQLALEQQRAKSLQASLGNAQAQSVEQVNTIDLLRTEKADLDKELQVVRTRAFKLDGQVQEQARSLGAMRTANAELASKLEHSEQECASGGASKQELLNQLAQCQTAARESGNYGGLAPSAKQ